MEKLIPPVEPVDHIRGDRDAPVTLVEYGDFECPYCARAHAGVEEVRRRMGRDLRYVFRHFPLVQMHPHARMAAEAAEAATLQGKFWLMHDLLFENQDALELEDLIADAEDLGLDTDRFGRVLASHAVLRRVERDVASGERSGVHGTPTFFINEVRYEESWDPDTLTAALRAAIGARAA